ncbi:MAG: DedA family protein [Gammaproteobacteria bacterium]|nr:DedA family protein [Gammaproteobacteria bacterium]
MDVFSEFGLWGLGISAFLAATILPLSSELVLTTLMLSGESAISLLLIASTGNVAGSMVNYLLGRWGADLILQRWFHLSSQQVNKAEYQFKRYGKWSLLFAWLPIIGDPLTFVAGMLKINFFLFVVLVTIGKAGRYWLIIQTVLASQS